MNLSTTGRRAIGGALIVFSVVLAGTTYVTYEPKQQVSELPSSLVIETIVPQISKAPQLAGSIKLSRLEVPESQVVMLTRPVGDSTVEQAIEDLETVLEDADAAYLVIDSPGGAVFAGVKLMDFMASSKKPIYTVCIGVCASMAAHIFNSGAVRYIVPVGVIMHHQVSGGLRGNLSEMAATMKYIQRLSERMDREVAKRSKLTYEQFRIKVLENVWADAEESLAFGLADKAVVFKITNKGPKRQQQESIFLISPGL